MSSVGEAMQLAAATMDLWRTPVVMALFGVVIGSLHLYASLVGEW